MALAGCPDSFLHHPYYQDDVDRSSHRTGKTIGASFQTSCSHNSTNNQDDDVDLEALVNDMNSSFDSLYSVCCNQSETLPLIQNDQPACNQLSSSGTNSPQPTSPRQKLLRSQPMHILAVRRLQEEDQFRTSSLPAIPNPFPELCSPASSPVLTPSSMPQSPPTHNHVIKVFGEDGTSKAIELPSDMTARDICQLLIERCHCVNDNSWTLIEHHPHLGLERCLEDHELVLRVQSTWTVGNESKLLFRKNYAKYEFFKHPVNFLNSSSCPEIQGFLHVKELGKKSWKKLFVFLRRSGLYFSSKGNSKEPRHLQLLADIEDNNIFSLIAGKKTYSAPTDYGFCIKPIKMRNETKDLRLFCAEDEQTRTYWMTGFRLFKYGILLYQNFRIPQPRKTLLSHFSTPARSISENSLVAMDFSGQTGRVIEDPAEAQSAAMEEGQTWRKRNQRMNTLGSSSPLHPPTLSHTIHRTQPWFHGRITRKEAHSVIEKQGLVDGLIIASLAFIGTTLVLLLKNSNCRLQRLFLLRDSQSNPKTFVLTLYCQLKIRHFQILPCEENGQLVFSLDDGNTRFADLIQLVEFYQLNRGILPCKLKHYCAQISL
ncbi:growth factor receptor-bound protein 10 isoform X2 [Narcine bancroftii]|uniref:growth factor receptor-bound protein 10 isoform X2 n=1 Tax=Narcine bancroftii TaxID=1343680 RepID=UPI003831A1F5